MNITVHTRPSCQPCRLTRMKLDGLGIDYTAVELTEESVKRFKEADLLTAPVVEVDFGDDASWSWAGYAPSHIERLQKIINP